MTAGFGDKTARVWDAATGGCLAVLGGHEGDVLSAAFSPDGRRAVTAGLGDQTARVWDAATAECLAVLGGHEGDVLSAAFSPDGRRVVTAGAGDQTARVWKRVRPEYRWGVVAMPELWATVAFCALLAWSILRDRRRFRAASV